MKFMHLLVSLLSFFVLINQAFCITPPDSTMIAFYNVENLFDTIDDPNKNDADFLPNSDYKWNTEKYNNKLHNLSSVIASMNNGFGPTILGVCEIENKNVLNDLTKQPLIKNKKYNIVHYESADERGIDVGLLYKKDQVKVLTSGVLRPDLSKWKDKTRDVLYVQLKLNNREKIWVMVCHLPSRREGQEESDPKRVVVANMIASFRDSLLKNNPLEKLFIIGDFNDEPENNSMKFITSLKGHNAMQILKAKGEGSSMYNNEWIMLDQIVYFQSDGKCLVNPASAEIFDPNWLKQHGNPKYEGSPLRTFGGRKYLNGYSDHFPVSIQLFCPNKFKF
jgi:predicted extracellular nuclease